MMTALQLEEGNKGLGRITRSIVDAIGMLRTSVSSAASQTLGRNRDGRLDVGVMMPPRGPGLWSWPSRL